MRKKILIIEDDTEFIEVLELILGSSGYQTISCGTAEEGLKRAKEERPDLIILDVMLDGLSEGFKIARILKRGGPDSEYRDCSKIPILMVSAVSEATKMDFLGLAGTERLPVEAFMEKPVEPAELLARVKKLLG